MYLNMAGSSECSLMAQQAAMSFDVDQSPLICVNDVPAGHDECAGARRELYVR
jgi:hypothetical protein